MGRGRGEGGKEERGKGTRTLSYPDAEMDGHRWVGKKQRGSYFHGEGKAMKFQVGPREQESGRKWSPHGPPTSQNCVPEEQYPCPQVPEEPGIGPKTGALKRSQIMCGGPFRALA